MAWKILDVSKYQPNIDYAACAKDIDGVILRIGLTYYGKQNMGKDEYFEKHYAGFKAQGTRVGVYYYSAADSVAVAQKEADYCLSLLKGKQFELPIYYDVENSNRQGSLSKELLTQIVDAFCSRVQAAGYFVGYYSYTAWLQSKFDTEYLSNKYTLWKADYRSSYDQKIKCDLHQYTSSGSVAGISGRVDLSTDGNKCTSGEFQEKVAAIKAKGLNGFPKSGGTDEKPNITVEEYSTTDFVKEVQAACGAKVDGIAGKETLSKTVTVSKTINNRHAVVAPIQRRLNSLGYDCGKADGIAGSMFDMAVCAYQKSVVGLRNPDGEITAGNKTWQKLLGMA